MMIGQSDDDDDDDERDHLDDGRLLLLSRGYDYQHPDDCVDDD